jgi:hypothetical protein
MPRRAHTKKFIVLLICMLVVLILLLSQGYIAVHADHDCSGERCFICAQIHVFENLARRICIAYAAVIAIFITSYAAYRLFPHDHSAANNTPVLLEIRKNN